jgi:hypothetical protein
VPGRRAGFWLVSDLGYCFGLPALGIGTDDNGPWPTLRNRVLAAALWSSTFALILIFLHWGLPALPMATWPADLGEPQDLPMATPADFFHKTVEIVFQQLLVLAMTVRLSIDGLPLRTIALFSALLFGGMHILLAFSGIPPRAVIMFIVGATAFGAMLPKLILHTRFGLAAAFALHWPSTPPS